MTDKKRPLPFKLRGYEFSGHDEQDVYGAKHDFHFKAGDQTDIANYRVGRVAFLVGGVLRNGEGLHIVTDFLARIDFPPKEATELAGRFATGLTPVREELEVLADGLMLVMSQPSIQFHTSTRGFALGALDLGPRIRGTETIISDFLN